MSYAPQSNGKAEGDLATVLTRLTAARASYLDNINQAGLLQITPTRAAYSDKLPNIEEDAERAEQHVHARNRIWGKSGDQSGTNWGDVDSLTPYRAISGDDDFGSDPNDEALILGTTDTPVFAGRNYFDAGRIMVVATNSTSPWIVRIIWGTAAQSMTQAEAAGQYSDIFFVKESNAGWASIAEIRTPLIDVGSKLWIKGKNATNNATLDFLVSTHEYIY